MSKEQTTGQPMQGDREVPSHKRVVRGLVPEKSENQAADTVASDKNAEFERAREELTRLSKDAWLDPVPHRVNEGQYDPTRKEAAQRRGASTERYPQPERQAEQAPPVIVVQHRWRANGMAHDSLLSAFVKSIREGDVVSITETFIDGESWFIVTEQKAIPAFYSPTYYQRRDRVGG